MCSIYFSTVSFHFITHNLISELICFDFLCMDMVPNSGENVMSTVPLEVYLMRKMVTCSKHILPAVSEKVYFISTPAFFPC